MSFSPAEKFHLCKIKINFDGSKGKLFAYDKNKNWLFFNLEKMTCISFKPSKYKTKYVVKSNLVNISANQVAILTLMNCGTKYFLTQYSVKTSKSNNVNGFPILPMVTKDCIPNKFAKSKKVRFKRIAKFRSKSVLELLHMDLCSSIPVLWS